jgi:hypothetical protein
MKGTSEYFVLFYKNYWFQMVERLIQHREGENVYKCFVRKSQGKTPPTRLVMGWIILT